MKHPPFDFCDDCGGKFAMEDLQVINEKKYLCRQCSDAKPDSWRKAGPPKDDYDRITKCGDDR